MANAFEELEARLRLDASEFSDGVRQATDDLDRLEQKSSAAREAIVGFGAAAGAAAAGGIAASIKAAASFEDQMTKSMAVVGDVSEEMRGKLETTAREVARTTTHSAEDAAESYYFLASAGLSAEEQLSAMPEVASFASAGAIEMGEATDYATDIMAAFGYEADNLSKVTDTLTATFSNHNQTAKQMGTAMSYVAPVASEMGMEIENVSAAIGMMGDAGIKGSRAGTALRQALASLASPSSKQADLLEELGVQATNSEGDMRDFTSIVRDLEQAGISSGQVMELFGTQAGPGMQVLLSQGADALEENTNKISEMGGITQEVAKNQMQSFTAQSQILISNIRDIGISIGQVFLPPLTTLMSTLTGVIQHFSKLNDRFDGLPAAIGLAATAIGGFGTAALALQGTALAALVPSLGAVAVAAGTVGTAIAATGTVIGAAAAAWNSNFGGIRDFTEHHMSSAAESVRTWTSAIASTLEDDVARIGEIWGNLSHALSQATRRALAVTNRIIGQISDAWEGSGIDTVAIIDSTAGRIVARFEQLATTVGTVTRAGVERFITLWREHGQGVIDTVSSFAEQVVSRFKWLVTTVGTAIRSGIGRLSALWNEHGQVVIDTVTSFVGRVVQLFTDFVSRVTQIWNQVSEPITNAINQIVIKGFELAERFGLVRKASDTLGQKLGDLVPSIIGLLNPVTRVISIVNRLSQIWTDNWGGIQEKTTVAVDSITQTLGRVDEKLVQPGLKAISGVFGTEGGTWKTTMTETFDSIETTFTESFESIETTATTALGDVTAAWQTHGEDVGIAMDGLLVTIREAFGQIRDEILPQFVEHYSRIFGRFTEAIEELWSAHAGQLTTEFLLLSETLIGHLDTLIAGFMRLWEMFGDEILTVAELTFSVVLGVFKTFADGLLTALATLSALFRGDWESAWEYVSGFFERTFNGMLEWVKEWGGRFLSWLGGLVGDVIGWFEDLAYQLVGGSVIPEMFGDIYSEATSFGSDFVDWVSGLVDDVVGWFEDMKTDAVGYVEDLTTDSLDLAEDWVSDFKKPFEDALGWVEDKFGGAYDEIVGNSIVPDMFEDVLDVTDSWSGEFTDKIGTAISKTLSRFSDLDDAPTDPLEQLDSLTGNARATDFAELIASKARSESTAGIERGNVSPSGNQSSDTQVTLDLGSIPDDAYITVSALKELIKSDLNQEAKIAKQTTPGAQ